MNRKGISLIAFRSIEEIREAASRFPSCFFELSYGLTEEKLERILPILENRISSLHSLTPRREYFPNFASKDNSVIEWSERELEKDTELAVKVGADLLVLHPGYLTDSLVPTDAGERINMMEALFSSYVLPGTSSISRPDYITSPEYRAAFSIMRKNIEHASRKVSESGIKLAIENLNPRAGYMLIHPDEIMELSNSKDIYFTIDIGHLWVTTELYGLDFLGELKRILETGKVMNTHLHSNISDGKALLFEDSHQSLDANSMPWQEALELIESYGPNMTIEAKADPLHNLELLMSN